MEDSIKQEATANHEIKAKPQGKSWVIYFAGVCLALFSAFLIYAFISDGFDLTLLLVAFGSALLAFLCLSPWRRYNFLVGGLMVLAAGVWLMNATLNDPSSSEYAYSLAWAIGLLLIGIALCARFFNTTLFGAMGRVAQTRVVRKTVKIIGILLLVLVGLLIIGGLFSFIAGLSAMTIIIILLVLILLK